jgi:NADH-quinone oxidoreductase subunit I
MSTPDATEPPPRSRGVIALEPSKCPACMVCVRECPDWCITVEGHTETVPSEQEGRRPVTTTVLDAFRIDWSLCLYCGICVEVCPYDALSWQPAYAYPAMAAGGTGRSGLTHDVDLLASWLPGSAQG